MCVCVCVCVCACKHACLPWHQLWIVSLLYDRSFFSPNHLVSPSLHKCLFWSLFACLFFSYHLHPFRREILPIFLNIYCTDIHFRKTKKSLYSKNIISIGRDCCQSLITGLFHPLYPCLGSLPSSYSSLCTQGDLFTMTS